MKSFRKQIRTLHREFDGLMGRLFSSQKSLKDFDRQKPDALSQEPLTDKIYSRKNDFSTFKIMPVHRNQNLSTCDLKVYQDLFVYSFILENLPPNSKILEIGGGESRIISELSQKYEFWNLDKLEGQGHGPTKLYTTRGFTLVQANLGDFSDQLPDNYFDLVFSISVVEHFPEDDETIEKILADLKRVMKAGAYSVHCIDSLCHENQIWFHPFIGKLENQIAHLNIAQVSERIRHDKDLWILPKYAYYTRWFPKTKQIMATFGKPFSFNLIWQK